MKKEDLFDAMNGIDEEILERSEKTADRKSRGWITVISLAACLCVVLGAWLLLPGTPGQSGSAGEEPSGTQAVPPPANGNWIVRYNQDDTVQLQMTSPVGTPSYQEKLSQDELESVLPVNRPSWMKGSGYAVFREDKTPGKLVLSLETPLKNTRIQVVSLPSAVWECVLYPGQTSVCNGVEFWVYRYADKQGRVTLKAAAWIGDYWHLFTGEFWADEEEAGKAAFKEVLESFTYYGEEGKPTWSGLSYEYGDVVDDEIGLADAMQDPSFGSLIPRSGPEGTQFNTGLRYKDAVSDRIQVSWQDTDRRVSWDVEYYDPDAHSRRMSDTEDLWRLERESNVIIAAEDLTKRFVTEGYVAWIKKSRLSVRYEDKVISIGFDNGYARWVWAQLEDLGIVTDHEGSYTYREVFPEDRQTDPAVEKLFPESVKTAVDQLGVNGMYYLYKSDTQCCLEAQMIAAEEKQQLLLRIVEEEDPPEITAAEDKDAYDLGAYAGPWDPEIPRQYADSMRKPVFAASELTAQTVAARTYRVQSVPEERMEFGVRYGTVTVWVFASGFSAEEVYHCLAQLEF